MTFSAVIFPDLRSLVPGSLVPTLVSISPPSPPISLLTLFSFAMNGPKKLSASEVSLHTSKKDCWLIIHGKVYDVTAFLEEHPGGEEALIHASASGDATESFEDVGHSSTATSMMTTYLIGVLDGDAPGAEENLKKGESEEARSSKATTLQENKPSANLFDFILPLIILGVAFGAWYFLTYKNQD